MDTARVATPINERDVFAPPIDDLPPAFPVPGRPVPGTGLPALPPPFSPPALPPRWSKRRQAVVGDLAPFVQGLGPTMRAAAVLEIERGTPFLLVPVFLAVGAIVYFNLAREPAIWMLAMVAAIAAALYGLTRHRPLLKFPGAALSLILAGLVLSGIETARHPTMILGGEISTTLTGRVLDMDLLDNGRTRLVIEVIETEKPKLRYAPQRVRVSARAVPAGLQAGWMVKGLARLQPPSGPVRPGSYDFAFESYFDDIGATGFFMRGPELLPQSAPVTHGQAFAGMIANTRLEIADRVRARIGGAEGDIAAALMVGVRAGIPDDVNEAMRRAGLYHIISISGLHMALVAGVFMGFLRAVLALFPRFASRHPVKKIAAFAAILAITAYLFISGGEVAAERSFIMLAVMLAAVLFDRAALTMRNLAISAMVVMVLSPHEIVGPSFQMSFAATAALVGAFAWWSDRPARRARHNPVPQRGLMRAGLARAATVSTGLVVTSLIAGLATAAFGIYHFQRVSPLGLASNLAAMPFVSLVVMPCAVLAALAMPFGLEGPFLDAMGWGLTAMIAIARWFSDRSPVDAVGQISGLSVVLLAIALVVSTMSTTMLRLIAVPIALAGLLALFAVRTPDILVSEDGKLVGVATGSGAIAVDRDRPNAFTLVNWKRTFGAEEISKPAKPPAGLKDASDKEPQEKDASQAVPKAKSAGQERMPEQAASAPPAEPDTERFVCDDTQCVIGLKTGGRLVHTSDVEIARNACLDARVIVLDDPTVDLRCADPSVAVIGAKALALSGSAAIDLDGWTPGATPVVDYSIDGNARPWHRHRIYSRAARGMPPFVPKSKSARQPPAQLPADGRSVAEIRQ